jgi:hypothetical protein
MADEAELTSALVLAAAAPVELAFAAEVVPATVIAADAPASDAMAPAPSEPTAKAPAAIAVPVVTKSPPVRAGEPPSTALNSLGICQQSIMKITAPPMVSNAVIAGCAEAPTVAASAAQLDPKLNPAVMRQ